MIRFSCPACGSTLNAKDELAGQRRKCPKCAEVLVVPNAAAEPAELSAADSAAQAADNRAAEGGLAARPPKLCRHFRYLICDRQRLLALWQNNGQGWQMRVNGGWASVSRFGDQLPTEGDFKLIELRIAPDDGHRLAGLRVYQLARRWALRQLPKSEDAILKSVVGSSGLFREHKMMVREQLKIWLMPEVWEDNREVVEYLTGADCHSPGAGQ